MVPSDRIEMPKDDLEIIVKKLKHKKDKNKKENGEK